MEPFEYLRIFRRRWRVLAACVLVAVAAAWVTTPTAEDEPEVTYRASHTLIIDARSAGPSQGLDTTALFVTTGEVPRRVADAVGWEGSPTSLADRVGTEVDPATQTLVITAEGTSAESAAELANAFADELRGLLTEQASTDRADTVAELQAEVDALEAEIAELDAQIFATAAGGGSTALLEAQRETTIDRFATALEALREVQEGDPAASGYLTLEPASPEAATVDGGGFSPPTSRTARVGIALALGSLVGVAAVLVLERIDPRIHTRVAAERAFELPVVAEVPLVRTGRKVQPSVWTHTEPGSAVAEAYRAVRAAVLLMPILQMSDTGAATSSPQRLAPRSGRRVLVTSPEPGVGKTTTVANLAAAFAELGRSVIVINADVRRPEVHRALGAPHADGLSELLRGDAPPEALERSLVATSVPGVRVLSDPSATDGVSFAARGTALLEVASRLADVVLVDTPPILALNDTVELVPYVDTVLLVGRTRITTVESASAASELMARLGAPVTGVVLVGSGRRRGRYAGYYYVERDRRRSRRRDPDDEVPVDPAADGRDGHEARSGTRSGAADERAAAAPSATDGPALGGAEAPTNGAGPVDQPAPRSG